jgi:glycosyltransferase involved in cell wall biosynthesis
VIFAYGTSVFGDLVACGVPSEKIIVTWGGDIARSPPRVAARERDVVAAVGRLDPRKGFDTLIRAMVHVRMVRPSAALSIYGEGEQRAELEALIRECRVEHGVRLHGWHSDVWSEAVAAALLVCCSRSEGVPSVVLEAMSRDVPVLASTSVAPTISPFDPDAISCSSEDPVALGRAIAVHLARPDGARHAAAVGRRIRASLDQTTLSDQLVRVYRQAAA